MNFRAYAVRTSSSTYTLRMPVYHTTPDRQRCRNVCYEHHIYSVRRSSSSVPSSTCGNSGIAMRQIHRDVDTHQPAGSARRDCLATTTSTSICVIRVGERLFRTSAGFFFVCCAVVFTSLGLMIGASSSSLSTLASRARSLIVASRRSSGVSRPAVDYARREVGAA